MVSPINIHDSGKIIELFTGIYSVKVLGGWGVKVGDFSFTLKNIKNNRIIRPKGTQLRVQSFELNKRAKKIMSLDIPEYGKYIIEFKNQSSLEVRYTNLFISKLFFEKPMSNKSIEIYIG